VLRRPLVAPTGKCAYRCRSRIENAYLVSLDDGPEAIRSWKVRGAFIHETRCTIQQRAINDIAVPRDPADISRAEVGVLFLKIENPFGCDVRFSHIAARGVHNAL